MANDAINIAQKALIDSESRAEALAKRILTATSQPLAQADQTRLTSFTSALTSQNTETTPPERESLPAAERPGPPLANPVGDATLISDIVQLTAERNTFAASAKVLETADQLADELIGSEIDQSS